MYAKAQTPFPSDSFPGLIGQVTGGNPATTGIYYDDAYNRNLFPAGTTLCQGTPPGAEVTYFEQLDKDMNSLDAGQGIPKLYNFVPAMASRILKLTGDATSLIDPTQLPVDPATCTPVYPHQYLMVNTVFEVARAHGLHTAWSDKHPAYEILNGPSGKGVEDLFAPEINSSTTNPAVSVGPDWTKDNVSTQTYDAFKVQALLNEIKGYNHAGSKNLGAAPAIFGMNFQAVSTAQKLPTSHTATSGSAKLAGGYLYDAQGNPVPGPVLAGALDFINAKLADIANAVDSSTVIILSAKHGQSPLDRAKLLRIDDGAIVDALNAAWRAETGGNADLVAHAMDDDAILLWLNDHSQKAADFAAGFLLGYNGTATGVDDNGASIPGKPFKASGLAQVYAGKDAAQFMGVQNPADPHYPDVVGIVQEGVVYTGGTKKIAEHGGDAIGDRQVPILVWGPGAGVPQGKRVEQLVGTVQIAPTILQLLGLDPLELKAVAKEGTEALPKLF